MSARREIASALLPEPPRNDNFRGDSLAEPPRNDNFRGDSLPEPPRNDNSRGHSLPEQWFGLFSAANTPRPVANRIHQVSQATLQDQQVKRRIVDDGAEPASSTSPEQFAAFVRNEVAKWGKVVKAAGITAQ